MKYKTLLKLLKALIRLKRCFWWISSRIYFVLAKFFGPGWRFTVYVDYKARYLFKKIGLANLRGRFFKRDFLQIGIFLFFFFIALPHTKLYAKKDTFLPGQNTIAYSLVAPEEEYSLEEISVENVPFNKPTTVAPWRAGAVSGEAYLPNTSLSFQEWELAGVMAGGSAISKPILMPGASLSGLRYKTGEYIVEPGDSLSSIADNFDISVATILWENNLNLRSVLRPGDVLRIPPTTGVMHKIKKGDTLKKIAKLYGAKEEDIIKFNKLKEDGSDLIIGEKIMIPNGVKPQERALAGVPSGASTLSRMAVPPGSKQSPLASGFVWPTSARVITQYFTWKHYGVDIAGPWQSLTYAAKAGVVEKSQCGWNSGYGCYIIIDHGGGVKTLYGHHSRLLVFPGDYVKAGQTIGLMGNTGKVRGRTGIHLHFEIRINGVRVNPLGYIR